MCIFFFDKHFYLFFLQQSTQLSYWTGRKGTLDNGFPASIFEFLVYDSLLRSPLWKSRKIAEIDREISGYFYFSILPGLQNVFILTADIKY